MRCFEFFAILSLSSKFCTDIVDMAVFRNELFCLHGDGRLSHLLLLPVERCVERLMKRENWTLAATVCCMFQQPIVACRVHMHALVVTFTFAHTLNTLTNIICHSVLLSDTGNLFSLFSLSLFLSLNLLTSFSNRQERPSLLSAWNISRPN